MKPIAWINEYDQLEPFNPDNRQEWIPLYTQKELTDEEITSVFRASSDHIEFARAILRKAQNEQ